MADVNLEAYGKIFVSASGGMIPLSVSLDAPPSSFPGPAPSGNPLNGWHTPPYTFGNLNTGSYRVYVQDVLGCIQSYVVDLGESQYPTFSFHATNVSCFGQSDGSLTGSVEGGIPPYSYSVEDPNGETASLQNVDSVNLYLLNTGSYTITIEDSVGCSIQQNFVISGPASMSFSASADYSSPDSSSITFYNTTGTSPNTTYYVAEYDRRYNPGLQRNIIGLYSSSEASVPIPPDLGRNPNYLRGGHFGAYMETPSSIDNVVCSSDEQPIEVYSRAWAYRQSYCEQVTATSQTYRILNFYRNRNIDFRGNLIDPKKSLTGGFLGGMPLDGLNIRIYTGSADEVNYDPSNPTRDKLVSEFNTSGSLTFTGSFSYITTEDLVVVMENAETNTRYTSKILKKFPGYNQVGQDITSSLIVTGALMSGSDDNYVQSRYFGNIGNAANTGSLILTMSKVNDQVQSTTVNFEIVTLYNNFLLNP